ncbi:hypothetical protein A4V08_11325 [Lachnoclostridium sp. YL32]|nr:hypothetical protein A4V08_11325 [Lachnoclostridium sp. YL32]
MDSAPFPLHCRRRVFRTAGNPIFIQRTVSFRKSDFALEWNICFLNRSILKKVFINFDGIKSSIPRKNFRVNQRMFLKEIL